MQIGILAKVLTLRRKGLVTALPFTAKNLAHHPTIRHDNPRRDFWLVDYKA